MRIAFSALIALTCVAIATPASAQTASAPAVTAAASTTATTGAHPRNRSEELGAGVGLVALGVVGGAFTALTFLESEIRQFPPMCPGMGCPADPPVVAYDPNLIVMGAILGAASVTSIVIGAVLYLAPALALPEAPLAVAISPTGASASLSLRW